MNSKRLLQIVGAALIVATVGVVSCQALIAAPPGARATGGAAAERSGAAAGR